MIEETKPSAPRVLLVKGQDVKIPISHKMTEDPFEGYYDNNILEPPYPLEYLVRLPDESNILSQCVEAMVTNVDGYGFTLEPIGGATSEKDGNFTPEAEAERKTIEHFFEFCNQDLPYTQLRRRVRWDLEVLGNGYWEILRDGKGDIVWIEHIEGHTMRLTKQDDYYTDMTLTIRDDASNELQEYPTQKRFRRFVQIRSGVKVYFKEFGDPRPIDAETGEVLSSDEISSRRLATEVIHFKIYSPYTSYGVPRWIGNFLAVKGSRQAEEVNFEYFENNTIPPLALLVAGQLGAETTEQIKDFIDAHMKGRKGFNKILVVEAQPFGIAVPGEGSMQRPSIQVEHLSDAQQKDSLFDNYDATNREKVRSSFRIPPIYVGLTSDYTRATAKESREIAEEQVFGPERADHDFVINRLLFPAMKVRYWKYKSLPPASNDAENMSGVIQSFANCGLTVREARDEISKLLNHPLTALDDGKAGTEGTPEWLDLPLPVYLAQLQHGAQDAAMGTDETVVQKSAVDKEALLLQAVLGIQKAIGDEDEHEHHAVSDASSEA